VKGPAEKPDKIETAARRLRERVENGERHPEPSLGARLGQIGVLGWTIVLPTLAGALAGRTLDRHFGTGVFFSAPLIMLGAAFGFISALKWVQRR